ncbi:hypothetical protein KJ766_01875, partial [Patescibacteria group bacterium]|nr:hypothetical protein [Patescibacteria group bacterium]
MAVTMLSAFILAMSGAFIYSQQSVVMAGVKNRAAMLADGAIESVRTIRDGGWNELTYGQSSVEVSGGSFIFSG